MDCIKNQYLSTNNAAGKYYSDRSNPRAFNKAPKIIVFSGELTTTEKTFYFILQDYQWRRVNPSQTELAQILGCTERNIRKLTKRLKEAGLIKVICTGRANRYLLTDLETTEMQAISRPAARTVQHSGQAAADQQPQPTSAQVDTVESQPEQVESQPEIFLPTIADSEFQVARNSSSGFELNPINKNNKNHVCSTLYDIPQRDMTGTTEPTINPSGEGSRVLTLVVGGGETPLVVQGAKSPALFSKPAKTNSETELDKKQYNFVKTFENLQEFGFSEAPAQQILELAYKRHGDLAGDYLNNWAARINNYSWVENPQGYMRRAVVENWSVPKQKQQRNSDPAGRHATSTATRRGSTPGRGSGASAEAKKLNSWKKYATTSPVFAGDSGGADQDSSSNSAKYLSDQAAQAALKEQPLARDSILHLEFQRLDQAAARRIKHLALSPDGSQLLIKFFGVPPELSSSSCSWLSAVQRHYPDIEAIEIRDS